jgi:ribose transport system permease protein
MANTNTTSASALGAYRLDPAQLGLIGAFVILIIVAQWFHPGFLTWSNIRLILIQNAPLGIIAVGMTFVMISGGFDLSVGATYAFAATMFAKVANSSGLVVAGIEALVLGLVCGLINGVLVAVFRVNAFVATLGTASIFSGTAYVYSNSQPFVATDRSFFYLGQGTLGPLPVAIWILLAIILIGGFVLSRTVFGQAIYAVGGNETAARLSGMRVGLIRISAFAAVGVLSALAGMIQASRLGVGQADIGGTMPLDAIAVVVIGGTSLFGGEGAIWRTVMGLLFVGVITNLFYSLAVDSNIQLIAKGLLVIAAVWIDVWLRSRR